MFTRAIVRTPCSTFADGLTTVDFGRPDLGLALQQHARYCDALRDQGLRLTVLGPDAAFPDSTFVEDAAVLTPECAVITRPGAPSREGEIVPIRRALGEFYTKFRAIEAPGTLDGGDICEAQRADGAVHFFIGVSLRTNPEGAGQLARILADEGYTSSVVDIRGTPGILHLKSGLTCVGEGTLVAITGLAGHPEFRGWRTIRTARDEEYGANCIRVNDRVLIPAGLPAFAESLRGAGFETVALEMSEFRKMDGGLSCLSLRF